MRGDWRVLLHHRILTCAAALQELKVRCCLPIMPVPAHCVAGGELRWEASRAGGHGETLDGDGDGGTPLLLQAK